MGAMIRFYTHEEIDPVRWGSCVAASGASTLFADYDLLTLSNPQWGALVLDDYAAVMPLPWRRKHLVSYVFNPFFHSRLGVFAPAPPSAALVAEFVAAIPKRFVSVDLNLNEENSAARLSVATGEQVSHRLSLSADYDMLWQGYGSNHKRNVKAARAHLPQLDPAVPVSDIIALFRHNRGRDDSIRMFDADYAAFERLCAYTADRGWLTVWGARDDDGTLLAGAVFLRDGNRHWFWFSGREEARADRKAMFFLMDEFIRQNAGTATLLDFNGSRNPNVARFYAGFGGERFTFPALHFINGRAAMPFVRIYQKLKR